MARHAPARPVRADGWAGGAGLSPALLPQDEAARLEDLRALDVLDTPRERGFDRLVFIAAQVFRTPIAAVSFVGEDRQWFKAKVGLPMAETGREVSFCAHALHGPEPFVVRDTLRDPRFHRNPLVTRGPRLRFYAGVPLVDAGGHALGALCVLDREPRRLRAKELRALEELGAIAIEELKRRT